MLYFNHSVVGSKPLKNIHLMAFTSSSCLPGHSLNAIQLCWWKILIRVPVIQNITEFNFQSHILNLALLIFAHWKKKKSVSTMQIRALRKQTGGHLIAHWILFEIMCCVFRKKGLKVHWWQSCSWIQKSTSIPLRLAKLNSYHVPFVVIFHFVCCWISTVGFGGKVFILFI